MPERLPSSDLRVIPQGSPAHCLLLQVLSLLQPTDKINKKVIFKLPREAAVPLWVYLKILRAAAVHNNKSAGGREDREETGMGVGLGALGLFL